MKIIGGGLDDLRVQKLLAHHFTSARAETAPGSAHALDLSGLKSPDVVFWSAWDGEVLTAVGALKRLSASHGEIKSMHTDQLHRRKGVASAMLEHIVREARKMGLSRLSLETGSWPYFAPARKLYLQHGFVECPPFGSYAADPNSVFMTLELETEPVIHRYPSPGSGRKFQAPQRSRFSSTVGQLVIIGPYGGCRMCHSARSDTHAIFSSCHSERSRR